MSEDDDFVSHAAPSTVATVLGFGTISFIATAMASRTYLLGDGKAIMAASKFDIHNSLSPVENSFVSLFVLLYHWMLLGLLLLVTYILQNHPPFPHGDRASFDPDYLSFLTFLLLFLVFSTAKRNDGKNVRDTEKKDEETDTPFPDIKASPYDFRDENSTNASVLPSIASRSSYMSDSSLRSLESEASIEDVELDNSRSQRKGQANKGRKGKGTKKEVRPFGIENAGNVDDLEDVGLLDADKPVKSMSRSVGSRSHASFKTSVLSIKSTARYSVVDVLNVNQSMEWKGFLSSCFLIYQITDAIKYDGEVNLFYNLSQLGGSCFVFLTGFGHAMYFYTRNNVRIGRVLRVMFRLNLTALLLCAAMNRSYMQYYVCPLHSLTFLMTYGVMRVQQSMNYSKYGLRIKMLILAALIYFIWDLDFGLFNLLFSPFISQGNTTALFPNGLLWVWYSESHMHHWIGFVGIIYAINFPITSLLLDKMDTLTNYLKTLAKSTIGGSLIMALILWASGPLMTPKLAFNSIHSYFAFLPILTFIYFRNVTQTLRAYHLEAFKEIGKISLEIYLFHHYLFLADDGTSTLILVPGYPKCNIVVSTSILFLISRSVQHVTASLAALMLPLDDDTKCLRSAVTISVITLVFYLVAFVLDSMKLTGITSVIIVILLFGIGLYHLIMVTTWTEYKNMGRQVSTGAMEEEDSLVLKSSPQIIGTMVILVIGMTWYILSMAGATGGFEPLKQNCEEYANKGIWSPVTPCNEFQRGFDTRGRYVGAYYANCEDGASMHWGWREKKANLKCNFRSRSEMEVKKKLNHRKIVFVGDLTVRSLYFALCRLLGDATAGAFNVANADHSDISKVLGNTRLEYKWAPLAFDQVSKLRDMRTKGNAGIKVADLIVAGGGTLDRLHIWATDEDQESHKAAVQKLSKELEFAPAPTIWCTPTTINTAALGNEEKRSQMNEMSISQIRKMYSDLEIEESANFVLDGPSYSRGRVSESYDGVLYPNSVYDAGIQIVVNSLDWLLPHPDTEDSAIPLSTPGVLSNPFLGMMMICFSMIGLFFFDGYFGFSYLSSLFVRKDPTSRSTRVGEQQRNLVSAIMPNDLYDEAFIPYHQRLKLPFHPSRHSSSSSNFDLQAQHKKSEPSYMQPRIASQDNDILSILDCDSTLGGASSQLSTRTRRTVFR
jgi:10 TM Acyl Transferase domain found in Cas1p